MRTMLHALIASILGLSLAAAVIADVPRCMDVQGCLTDSGGDPVPPGLKVFTFRIFNQQAGGLEIWPGGPGEQHTLSTDADGLWHTAMGSSIPLTEAVFSDSARWLQVTVDDGVLPPETLPRIKLNTIPYAYRSYDADAIGGVTALELTDLYVNESGDTVFGQLLVDTTIKNHPSPVMRVNNVNDGIPPATFVSLTMGLAVQAASNGSERKYGIYGQATGSSGETFGVFGSGQGAGSNAFGVFGYTSRDADHNYAGAFVGGDLLVEVPDTPGDSAVRLPGNSIADHEIIDEPGISQGRVVGNIFVSGNSTMIDVVTTTIDIPTAGYIVVEASATAFFGGTTSSNRMHCQIDQVPGGASFSGLYQECGSYSPPNTSLMLGSVAVRRTYHESFPGSYTFRLEARDVTLIGNKGLFNPVITATFIPSGYGTVTTVAADRDTAEFENVVTATAQAPGQTRETGGPVHTVDLRELELRAARAQAEAERAQREYFEALIAPDAHTRSEDR